ncbi:MAG: polysaccharide biosynthesis/export family protein [Planctomycetota bacterium]
MKSRAYALFSLWVVVAALGCSVADDTRLSQILNQRGFGRKYVGDSNELYYAGIGDTIVVRDLLNPEIQGAYTIQPDGVINVPLLGQVFIAGMTIDDIKEVLNTRYRDIITTADVFVDITRSQSKRYYVVGEVARPGIHPFKGDETLFDVVLLTAPTIFANERAVRLIRADPVHPLSFEFNYKAMAQEGDSTGNVLVRENDIIYVPPHFMGKIAIFLETLLSPVTRLVADLIQLNNLYAVSQSFLDNQRFIYGIGGYNRQGIGFGTGNRFGAF